MGKGSKTMWILRAILMFSKGREPTLFPRVPLQCACSEKRGQCLAGRLEPSLAGTQGGALERNQKTKHTFSMGTLCGVVFILVSFAQLYITRKKRGLPGREKKQWLKYQSWHVFFFKNIYIFLNKTFILKRDVSTFQ